MAPRWGFGGRLSSRAARIRRGMSIWAKKKAETMQPLIRVLREPWADPAVSLPGYETAGAAGAAGAPVPQARRTPQCRRAAAAGGSGYACGDRAGSEAAGDDCAEWSASATYALMYCCAAGKHRQNMRLMNLDCSMYDEIKIR